MFFNDQFTFILDCPPGYRCAFRPPPIIIPPHTLPPIIPQNGILRLNCCQSPLTATIPPGATQAQIAGIVSNLFYQCALQQAQCNIIAGGPGIGPPPVRVIGPTRAPVTVYNTQQCFTAFCSVLPTGSVTICTPPGTFNLVAASGTPADIAVAQAEVNNWAFLDAENQAVQQAQASCSVCNSFLHGVSSCPGNPGLTCSINIPANKYCAPMGTPQAQVDAQASADLTNQLQACLASLGCSCSGPTVSGTTVNGGNCFCPPGPEWFLYQGAPIPANFIGVICVGSGTGLCCPPYTPAPGTGAWTLVPDQNPFNTISLYAP